MLRLTPFSATVSGTQASTSLAAEKAGVGLEIQPAPRSSPGAKLARASMP